MNKENKMSEETKTYFTEIGTVLMAVGGALLAGGQIASPIGDVAPWLTLIGTVLSSCGVSLLGYRMSKKLVDPAPKPKP